MLRQVEISARSDAFQLLRSEWEFEEDIDARTSVVGEFLLRLPMIIQHVRPETDGGVVIRPLLYPVAVPHLPAPVVLRLRKVRAVTPLLNLTTNGLDRFIRLDEELQLHLLEL